MSLKALTQLTAPQLPRGFAPDAPSTALEMWAERPMGASDDEATISILEPIGLDPWTGEGVTAKRISAALRSIGKRDVTVHVNSPGGYVDEGVTIYNLLAQHEAKVTIKVLGIAASAASIIAMAGDQVLMGLGSQMMIHRCWGLTIGNHHDLLEAAEICGKFDRSMAEVYAERTGEDVDAMLAVMDGPNRYSDGTWLTAGEAVERGFADATFEADQAEMARRARAVPEEIVARRQIEAAMAKQGHSRRERAEILKTAIQPGARDAAGTAARDAGQREAAAMIAAAKSILLSEA